MRDIISKKTRKLTIPLVLETVKERLIELRFNIDHYNIADGEIEGRRNSLDKIILGLYRKTRVKVSLSEKKESVRIDIGWGGLLTALLITGVWFFFISLAILRNMGLQGVLISLIIAFIGISLNLVLFYVMRARFLYRVKRDLHDLELHLEESEK